MVSKRRTLPFKLLYYILYGGQNWLLRSGTDIVEISTGPCARALRTSNSRLWEAITELALAGILSSIEKPAKGVCRLKYILPEEFNRVKDN